MHSTDGWTIVLSLEHEKSADSSSGTDATSLIAASPEPCETSYIDLDATWNMALPLGSDQPSSGNLSSVSPVVVDWVQKQSHPSNANDATRLPLPRSDGNLTRANEAKQARTRTDHSAIRQGRCQSAKKVYDIATLLSLRDTQSVVPVMLRVKPEAIAGDFFDKQAAPASMR